jgi:hypothetical protein
MAKLRLYLGYLNTGAKKMQSFTINGIELTRITTLQADMLVWGIKVRQNTMEPTPSPMDSSISFSRRKAMIKWVWSTMATTSKESGYGQDN